MVLTHGFDETTLCPKQSYCFFLIRHKAQWEPLQFRPNRGISERACRPSDFRGASCLGHTWNRLTTSRPVCQHWEAMEPTPRKLTTVQMAVLIRVLREFPDQQVDLCYHPSAQDALGYARDFLTVFKAIGWRLNDGAPVEVMNGQATGLAFVISEPGNLPPSAEALRDTLRIYGIEVGTFCDPACNAAPGGFILTIGGTA